MMYAYNFCNVLLCCRKKNVELCELGKPSHLKYFTILKIVSWCFDQEGTPVPIPNTEVKLFRTDGTP